MMYRAYLLNNLHLGDVIMILNLLHSRCMETQEQFQVFGSYLVKELCEVFDYKFEYINISPIGSGVNESIASVLHPILMYNFKFGTFKWNSHMIDAPDYDLQKIHLPSFKKKCSKNNQYTYFQFDMRSSDNIQKIKLSSHEMLKFIEQFSGPEDHIFGIGGHNTTPYLKEYPFHLGNVSFIVDSLLCCKKFIGVDSGISHLVGTIGCEGDVIVSDIVYEAYLEIKKVYETFYPSLRCHFRKRNPILM